MIASENEEYQACNIMATQAKEPVRHYEHKGDPDITIECLISQRGVGKRSASASLDEHIAKKKAIYRDIQRCFQGL